MGWHRHLADVDGNHWQDANATFSASSREPDGTRRALGHGKVAGGGVTIYSASEDSFVAEVTRPRTILCHPLASVAWLSMEKSSDAHISWLRFASARLAKPRLSAATKTRHTSHATRHFFPPWLGFWLVERRMKKRRQAAALQNGRWRFASSPIFAPRRLVFWWWKVPLTVWHGGERS